MKRLSKRHLLKYKQLNPGLRPADDRNRYKAGALLLIYMADMPADSAGFVQRLETYFGVAVTLYHSFTGNPRGCSFVVPKTQRAEDAIIDALVATLGKAVA